jgi:hypothetical protein
MSVVVNAVRLRQEIARRGWGSVDLARAARLSPATVSAALSGRPIAASSLNLMVKALASTPVDALIDRLLSTDGGPPGLAW